MNYFVFHEKTELQGKIWRPKLTNLSSCEIKAWKKLRPEQDWNPWPLRYRCSALPRVFIKCLRPAKFTVYFAWFRRLLWLRTWVKWGIKHFCVNHDAWIGQHLFLKRKRKLPEFPVLAVVSCVCFLFRSKTVAMSSLAFTHNVRMLT